MTDNFSLLLSELGKIIGLPLSPDKYNACSILAPPLTVQLELDTAQENLLFFTKIITLPPGRFLEDILCAALKANGMPDPRPGIFGYIAMTNHLALYQTTPAALLDQENLASLFGAFFALAESWHKAIEQGKPGPLDENR